jgi:hypothetical protein
MTLFALGLSGCGAPPALVIASYAADGASYIATGKSVTDHGISAATGRDCALWRTIKGNPVCADEPEPRGQPAPVQVGQAATQPATALRHYLVVGSFANQANAERFATGFDGAKLAVVPAEVAGQRLHRVVAGPLDEEEARAFRRRLAAEARPPAWEIAALE